MQLVPLSPSSRPEIYNPSPFRYPLSTIQRGLWCGGKTSTNMVKVVELSSNFNLIQLQQAVKYLERRHPLSRAKVDVLDDGRAYLCNDDVDEIPIVYARVDGQFDINSKAKSALTHFFDWRSGPLTRIELYQNEQRCWLLINMHHIISDGLSLSHYIIELIELLNEIQMGREHRLQYKPAQGLLNIDKLLPKPKQARWQVKLISTLAKLAAPWIRINRSPVAKDEGKLELLSWAMDEQTTLGFIDYCKQQRLSVNNVLAAICLSAHQEAEAKTSSVNATQKTKLGVPLSLRHRLKSNIAPGALQPVVSMSVVNLELIASQDIFVLAERIRSQLKQQMGLGLKLIQMLSHLPANVIDFILCSNAKKLKKIIQNKPELASGLLLSNLGCYQYKSNGPIEVLSDFGYICSAIYDKVAVVSVANNRLRFSYSYHTGRLNEDCMKAAKTIIETQVRALANLPIAKAS